MISFALFLLGASRMADMTTRKPSLVVEENRKENPGMRGDDDDDQAAMLEKSSSSTSSTTASSGTPALTVSQIDIGSTSSPDGNGRNVYAFVGSPYCATEVQADTCKGGCASGSTAECNVLGEEYSGSSNRRRGGCEDLLVHERRRQYSYGTAQIFGQQSTWNYLNDAIEQKFSSPQTITNLIIQERNYQNWDVEISTDGGTTWQTALLRGARAQQDNVEFATPVTTDSIQMRVTTTTCTSNTHWCGFQTFMACNNR